MFSPIWKLNSPSENRSVLAFPRSQTISAQISLANAGCALPEKILTFPVTLIKRTKRTTNLSLFSTLCHATNQSLSSKKKKRLRFKQSRIPICEMAGAGGIEPTNAGSKNRCLTTWLRPKLISETDRKRPKTLL